MAEIPRSNLFGKLNPVAFRSIEAATVFTKMRGNPYVELVHWIHQILQLQDTDIHKIIQAFGVEPSKLARDITESVDTLPRGASSISDLSAHIEEAVERGWVYATLLYNEPQVRTGYLMVGIVKTPGLKRVLEGISAEFAKIKTDTLVDNFDKITEGSSEIGLRSSDGFRAGGVGEPGEASSAMSPAQMGKGEALKQFCKDLTEEARTGKIDPIVGRDEETRQLVDILMRRRQNNPVLVGEAGVGKTAVAEGFAHKIIEGDVPPSLLNVKLLELDVSALQAGASMKGEFEERLKQVIEEVQASETPIVLFIDEVHRLIGAGGSAGTGDAAQLLKPALARGLLRTVAATTWAEYKKHIEKDPALSRRFQTVMVGEPTEERAILMMRKVAGIFEKHHKVQILDEAIEASVRLSHRYIPARQLPDKSVSLMDTACARVAIGQHSIPPEVDDSRKRIQGFETEVGILTREEQTGSVHTERLGEIAEKVKAEQERLEGLEADWKAEKDLVDQILDIRGKLRGPDGVEPVSPKSEDDPSETEDVETLSDADRATLRSELVVLQDKLSEMQGENPLILPSCDETAIAAVVSDWTGIPVGKMVKDEAQAVLDLAKTLSQRVVGQDHAMEMIARRIQTSRAGLDNPSKPIGVFMLAGTSGVGKTETALALAEALYGGEQNVITINMSEFQEAHTVSTLKGAPPGYVGYGEGGVLTEAVRRKPYSIVLLDEVEKAHPDVHEIFFQVFDKGHMEDGEGRSIDFKNTIILLTSNAGSDLIMNMCGDPELLPSPEALNKALREPLLKIFPAALLGRLVTIPYFPLNDVMIRMISKLQLKRVADRVNESHGVPFEYADAVIDLIVSRCTERDSGGRMIDAILTNTILPTMSEAFLKAVMSGEEIKKVAIGVKDDEFTYGFE
ncbi:MAG: type VI secretion system protein VasG [Phycisphaerales bacterium]|jgi:type VI secretion system protein VasG